MTSPSIADILALRIRASLERDYLAPSTIDAGGRGASAPRAAAADSLRATASTAASRAPRLGSAAAGGWGTRPIRRCTPCHGVVERSSLGWGTRPM